MATKLSLTVVTKNIHTSSVYLYLKLYTFIDRNKFLTPCKYVYSRIKMTHQNKELWGTFVFNKTLMKSFINRIEPLVTWTIWFFNLVLEIIKFSSLNLHIKCLVNKRFYVFRIHTFLITYYSNPNRIHRSEYHLYYLTQITFLVRECIVYILSMGF